MEAFDTFTSDTRAAVAKVFQSHGVPLPLHPGGDSGVVPVVKLV